MAVVCDRDPATAAIAPPGAAFFDDVRDLVAAPDVDAVVVTLPERPAPSGVPGPAARRQARLLREAARGAAGGRRRRRPVAGAALRVGAGRAPRAPAATWQLGGAGAVGDLLARGGTTRSALAGAPLGHRHVLARGGAGAEDRLIGSLAATGAGGAVDDGTAG